MTLDVRQAKFTLGPMLARRTFFCSLGLANWRRPGRTSVFATVVMLILMAVANGADNAVTPVAAALAERLTLQYHSGRFELVSRTLVPNTLPPSDELPGTKGPVSGFWFEVQSPQGTVKYRRVMEDPVALYTEVPAEAAEGSRLERAEAVPHETVFTLLVPHSPGSNQLVLASSRLLGSGKTQPAQVVARIPLPAQTNQGPRL